MNIREIVQERYSMIAKGFSEAASDEEECCCGPTDEEESCCEEETACCTSKISDTMLIYDGMDLSSLPIEAVEASLGCANPLVFAELKEGEVVLDLGSGGGIDVLLASRYVGASGLVYGLDMTDEMLRLAGENKAKAGAANVEFIKGYIEDIPLGSESVDVVLSNCVINLSEDKETALAEAYRVLKPGGRLRVADIIATKPLDPAITNNQEMWCSCLAGAILASEYEQILKDCGFLDISIEAVFPYSPEAIADELSGQLSSGQTDVGIESVKGAFAGALISANK